VAPQKRAVMGRLVRSRWFGIVAFSATVVVAMTGAALMFVHGKNPLTNPEVLSGLAFTAFGALAAFVLWRRPGHGFGLAVLGVGASAGLTFGLDAYARYSVATGSDLPLTLFAAWFQHWAWFLPIGLMFTFALLLFPTGRLPSRRWRWVARSAAVGLTLFSARIIVDTEEALDGFSRFENPTGIEALEGTRWILPIAFGLIVVSAILSVASVFTRYVGSRGDERQQVKWVLFGASVAIAVLLVMPFVPLDISEGAADVVFGICLLLLPLSFAIAMLRYRLYDVDVVINRTLVYGVLSAVLGAIYVGFVFGFQALLAPFTADSDLAIAGSTLAVAALFRPARSRVQSFIDRRFYRRKVDAQRTLEHFTTELRDEVDLRALSSRLTRVVVDTMQPAHVSLWLKAETPLHAVTISER